MEIMAANEYWLQYNNHQGVGSLCLHNLYFSLRRGHVPQLLAPGDANNKMASFPRMEDDVKLEKFPRIVRGMILRCKDSPVWNTSSTITGHTDTTLMST